MTPDDNFLHIWSLENNKFDYNVRFKPKLYLFNESDTRIEEKKYVNKSKFLSDSKTKKRNIFESKDNHLTHILDSTDNTVERNNIEPAPTAQPIKEGLLEDIYAHPNASSFTESNLDNGLQHSLYPHMSLNVSDKYYRINNYAEKLLEIAHTLHYVGISILAIFVIQVLWKY